MYSAADYYVVMLIIFGECGRNTREAARVFSDRFPDRPSPGHKTILRVLARAQEIGKVLPNRNEIGGGARTARILAILNRVEEDGTRRKLPKSWNLQQIGTSREFVLIVY
jgi:hypothetical protein